MEIPRVYPQHPLICKIRQLRLPRELRLPYYGGGNPTSYLKPQLRYIYGHNTCSCVTISWFNFQLNPTITLNDIIVKWSYKYNWTSCVMCQNNCTQITYTTFPWFLSLQVFTTLRLSTSRSQHGATTVARWSMALLHRVVSAASVGQRSITSATLLHQRSTVQQQVHPPPSLPPSFSLSLPLSFPPSFSLLLPPLSSVELDLSPASRSVGFIPEGEAGDEMVFSYIQVVCVHYTSCLQLFTCFLGNGDAGERTQLLDYWTVRLFLSRFQFFLYQHWHTVTVVNFLLCVFIIHPIQ